LHKCLPRFHLTHCPRWPCCSSGTCRSFGFPKERIPSPRAGQSGTCREQAYCVKVLKEMDLPLLSFSFLAFALTLYVILDGFDLGVGILLLLQPAGASRDHMVDSITPTWD